MEEHIETRTKATAQVMSHFVNDITPDYKGFCDIMIHDHPTLQQTFTRLCLEWIETMAERDERFIDPRNEASHKICQKIKNALSAYDGDKYWKALPMV